MDLWWFIYLNIYLFKYLFKYSPLVDYYYVFSSLIHLFIEQEFFEGLLPTTCSFRY